MRPALAIARRELLATFATLAGWIVVALFLLVCGLAFSLNVFRNGGPASLREVFQAAGWTLAFIAPAITMRSISDELRHGTYESLAAAPIAERSIILGKFIASLVMLLAMTAPLAVLACGLELHGRPDYGELLCGALGLVLFGGLYLATGILASTLTASQLVAYLLASFFWLLVILCCRALPPRLPEPAAALLDAADPLRRLRDFTVGILDSANVAYFAALTAAALAAATWSLRARREW